MPQPAHPTAVAPQRPVTPPGVDPLHAALGWLAPRAPSMVVHIGPVDEDVLRAYAQWRPARLLLVDGRPVAGPLAAARLDTWPGVTWRHAVVAAEAGPAQWHGHTLPRLDGVLRAEGLLNRYPGAAATGSIPVQAIALADVLDDLAQPERSEDTGRLLVLDVPGTEGLLLRSLLPQVLAAFDFVLYRGVQVVGHRGGQGARATLDLLRGRGFVLDREDTGSEPLWPVRLLSLAAAPREDAQLRDELAALREAHARLTDELAARTAQHRQQTERLTGEQADLREAHARLADELATERTRLREASTQLERLRAESKEATEQHRQRAEVLASERARLREASTQLEQLRAEAKQLAEQQARQAQELAEARQGAAQALKLSLLRDGDLRELQSRHVALTAERDALAASLAELGRRLDTLRAGLAGESAPT